MSNLTSVILFLLLALVLCNNEPYIGEWVHDERDLPNYDDNRIVIDDQAKVTTEKFHQDFACRF
ncbi:hypothetical protein AKO1_012919 [Acrasis kona]|uniref:Uncharacterized protein n=1 Tax=Acrasis kona TaxID=1008807 RepID=A0AAW2Z170_9EUKA